jgi:hydrogenase 3 maturation protease
VLVNTLSGKVDALCLDGGNIPENYLGKILKEHPDTVLIIDALHLGERPGTFKLLKPHELLVSHFTTHTIPLRILIEYLEDELHSDIHILGVQPSSLKLGESISEPVKEAIQRIATLIMKAAPRKSSLK